MTVEVPLEVFSALVGALVAFVFHYWDIRKWLWK